jgi:hypothetical protein
MVGWHYMTHMYGAKVVQGYTEWHRDIVSRATVLIDGSGMQAAWSNLKDGNGNWIREISPAFCLTTNYSINRQLFLNERFDETFSGAAWEDVEFGYRLSKYSDYISTIFEPQAINYHYHRYSIDSFLDRCEMEGYHRLTISKKHPEMAWNLVNPNELRVVEDINKDEMRKWVHEFEGMSLGDEENEQVKQLVAMRFQRFYEACKVFSLKGVLRRIEDEHPAMQALKHVHLNQTVIEIISGIRALEHGNIGYALHTAQWFVAERNDDWSAYAYLGEMELAAGNHAEAFRAFDRSASINPGEEWPNRRLKELSQWS